MRDRAWVASITVALSNIARLALGVSQAANSNPALQDEEPVISTGSSFSLRGVMRVYQMRDANIPSVLPLLSV
jgi:hypothetical protein